MKFKSEFNELYKEFLKNSIVKSLVYATLFSATCLFVISMIFWIIDVENFWIALVVFGVLEITSFFVLFYFLKPEDKKIAVKLDELGLKQRVITMHEYQNDDSLMARIQRQNAIEHINKIDKKLLKVVFPVLIIVFTIVSIVFGAAATTVSALSSKGVISNGKDVIEEIVPGVINQYELIYDVDGEGYIEGDMFQVVEEGKDGTEVYAEAEDGWAFTGWSDGVEDPYRIDLAITENLEVFAQFQELSEEEQDGDGEGDGEPSDGEQAGEPQESQESQANEQSSQDPSDQPGGGEGGQYEETNQVIDGETYYGDSTYDNAYNDAMNDVQSDNDMSDDMKSIIGDYYGTIEK